MSEKRVNKIGSAKVWVISISVIVLIAVIALLYVFVFSNKGPDENIVYINDLEADYIDSFNSFSTEYSIAAPEDVESLASIPRALDAVDKSKLFLTESKENVTKIKQEITEIKAKYEGKKLDWLNLMEKCYDQRYNELLVYDKVLESELKYFRYLNYSLQYDEAGEEFSILIDQYLRYSQEGNEQEVINTLNKIKSKTSQLKSAADNANAAIPFTFYQKRSLWASKFIEGIDLELEYYSNPSQTTLKKMNDKYTESNDAVSTVTDSSISKEFDQWYTDNVKTPRDDSLRISDSGNKECDSAYDLYSEAFPNMVTGNVIKELNYPKE